MPRLPRWVSALALCGLSIACYHATVETGASPSAEVINKSFASSWIYGLVPPRTVSTAAKCPAGPAIVETRRSFVNQLVGILTLGIYTPMEIKVTCAVAGPGTASMQAPTGPSAPLAKREAAADTTAFGSGQRQPTHPSALGAVPDTTGRAGQLAGSPEFRKAIHELERLQIASSVYESKPGTLIVELGSQAQARGTALAYELSQLYLAYGGTLGLREHGVIELWQGDKRVGEYTSAGLNMESQ
jgi:hypothetical protein